MLNSSAGNQVISYVDMKNAKDLIIAVLLVVILNPLATRDGAAADDESSKASKPSVAVLPFASVGGGLEGYELANSISDKTVDSLAKEPDIQVISRELSSQLQGSENDIRSLADSLGVSYLVEGSVRQIDSRVRIAAELISVDDAAVIMSEAHVSNVPSVEYIPLSIAQSIAGAIKAHWKGRKVR